MKRKVMSKSNRIFYIVNTVLLMICLLLVAMPILNVVASSLSSPSAVIRGQVSFWPKGWNIDAYTIVGTCVNIVLTIMAAYPLSVKDFIGRKVISALFIFVMIFTAPLIPTYLNVKNLGLLDSMCALILPGAISVYNMIIARTYFQNSIPGEMLESARLDGCDDIRVLVNMVLVLYYAIAHWNSYFDAFIYLSSENKFTLQVVLRNIMNSVAALEEMATTAEQSMRAANIEVLKYAIIVFGSIPLIILYPFVQKHFVKGVMIGSLKG